MLVSVTGVVTGAFPAISAPETGEGAHHEIAAANDSEAGQHCCHRAQHASDHRNAVDRAAQNKHDHADQEKGCTWDLDKFHSDDSIGCERGEA